MIESTKQDIAVGLIEDIIPERLIRVYPYELVQTDKSKTFLQANSVSIAAISQDKLDTKDDLLKTDSDGIRYFEMLAGITSEGKLDVTSATSVLGKELKEEDTFTCLSNWYYEGELDNIKIGNMRFIPAMFSIGKPFDKAEYEAGNQALFIPTSMVEAKEGTVQYSFEELNTEGLYEFNLVNVSTLEASFTNARILFNENALNLSDIENFSIEVTPDILIDKLKIKGYRENQYTDIDFTTKTKSAKLKVVPVSTQDKLTVFLDNFDADVFLSKENAERAIKEISLTDYCAAVGITDSLKDFITDSLLYSQQFSQRFGQIPRNDEAKIDKDWKIGSENDFLSGISGQNANDVIDGLYRNWRTNHPSEVGTKAEQLAKQWIAAMSDIISGSLSIGKGQSSYHKNYLLWYFELTKKLNVVVDDTKKTVTLSSDDVKFKVNSKYYTVGATHLEPMTDLDISEVQLIQSDRKVTLPELPDTITAINKLPLPGDINTQTSEPLNYFFNMFLTGDEIINFFGNTKLSNTPTLQTWSNKQLPERRKEYTAEEADKLIIQNIIAAVPDASHITKVNGGHSVSVSDPSKDSIIGIKVPSDEQNIVPVTGTNLSQKDIALEQYLRKRNTHTTYPHTDVTVDVWNDNMGNKAHFISEVASFYKVPESDVIVTSLNVDGNKVNLSYQFYITKYSWTGYVYEFFTKNNILEKATLYDKAKWKQLIKSSIDFGNPWIRPITFEEKYNTKDFEISEIIIGSIFGNELTLNIRSERISVPLFNKDDETIGVQRILFT